MPYLLPPAAEARLTRHDQFLINCVKSLHHVETAALSQLAILCEICFNVHKIPLEAPDYTIIMNNLPVIRHIGKCRKGSEARDLLKRFGSLFLPHLIKACRPHAAFD